MALSKLQFNSINVTPAASKAIRFNSGANGFETASAGGNIALIKTQTISSGTGTVSFVDGTSSVVLDNTYKEYIFFFNNLHPSQSAAITFNFSVDTGSNYNVSKTTTFFAAQHDEGDSEASLGYDSDKDLANATGFQRLDFSTGAQNDNNFGGYLHLFDPSNTTFVKHFLSVSSTVHSNTYENNSYVAGYGNTTSAIDAIQFKTNVGTLDAGSISLYGVN